MENNEDSNDITDEYDQEFMKLLMEIETRNQKFKKHDRLRVTSWCKKLCQVTNNTEWKKNRNLHTICLLDCLLNNNFEDPYNKFPPEGSIPILNKTLVKAKLSKKFINSRTIIQEQKSQETTKVKKKQSPENSKELPQKQIKQQREENYEINYNYYEKNAEKEDKSKLKDNEQLKQLISQLQIEGQRKDSLIQQMKKDRLKKEKKMQELERMLSNLTGMEK